MKLPIIFCLSTALLAATLYAEPGHKFPPISAEDLARIKAALPDSAMAKPTQPRKLLIFFRTEGYVHGSIPYCIEAIKDMGDHTGAYSAEASDDMAVFTPDNLKQYDAVLFDSTTQLKFADPANRQALLDFVKSGKGVIGIHAATDNFSTWPEGQELLGGKFAGHPWGSGEKEAVKLDDPKHPMNASFGGQGFWINDEIYQFNQTDKTEAILDRAKIRVLLSLDMSKSQNTPRDPTKIKRTDNDFPISWIKNVPGGGRVFYCSLGHNNSVYWTKQVLQHYLNGIQFALGDLQLDAVPSANVSPALIAAPAPDLMSLINPPPPKPVAAPKPTPATAANSAPAPTTTNPPVVSAPIPMSAPVVSAPIPMSATVVSAPIPMSAPVVVAPVPTTAPVVSAPVPTSAPAPATQPLDSAAVQALAAYDYGADRTSVVALIDEIRSKGDASHATVEATLSPLLSDAKTSVAGKDIVYRLLGQNGSDASVPALASRLDDVGDSHLAAYALFQIGTPAAQAALLASVDKLPAPLQPAVIGALGRLNDKDAVSELGKLSSSDFSDVSGAAWDALAAIATPEAGDLLTAAKAPTGHEDDLDWARIHAAKRLVADHKDTAVKLVTRLPGSSTNPSIQTAAISVLLEVDPASGWTELAKLLKSSSMRTALVASPLTAHIGSDQMDDLLKLFPSLDPTVQIVILSAVSSADCGFKEKLLTVGLASSEANVHLAAIADLGTADLPSSASTLSPFLTKSKDEADAAALALARLTKSDPFDSGLDLSKVSGPAKVDLINLIAARDDDKMKDAVFGCTSDGDVQVANAAYRAIGVLANQTDFDRVLALIPQAKNDDQKKSLNRAVSRAANLTEDKTKAQDSLIGALKSAPADNRQALILALATLNTDPSTAALSDLLKDPAVDNRKQVIRTLSEGRNSVCNKLLLDAAKNGTENSEKILALRGYLDAIHSENKDEKVDDLKKASELVIRQEEKDTIKEDLKNVNNDKSKALLAKLTTEWAPPTPTPMPTPAPVATTPSPAAPSAPSAPTTTPATTTTTPSPTK